ncbi:MAG: energy transducer TonB family protein [Gemmatimonadaceae bacterium]
MLTGVMAACASGTVRVYEPPQTAARISPAEMHTRLAEMMVVECPRLLGSRDRRRGAVTIGLAVDSSGRVERASIRRGSGDATFDDLAGGLAARLALAPAAAVVAADPPDSLTVLYECAPAAADVRVLVDSV